jgi:NAD+ kinase
VYSIMLAPGSNNAILRLDGQMNLPMTSSHRVTVRRAPVCFGLVKVAGRSYYQTLRDKLRWGTPPNYRAEPPPPL